MKMSRSATSRADRPANSLPPFSVSPRGAKALRLSAWTLLHTVVIGGVTGSLWWRHINAVPTIVVPPAQVISPNAYPKIIAATDLLRSEKEVGEALAPRKLPYGERNTPPKKVYTLAQKTALIAENAPALQAMRAALTQPAQTPPVRSFTQPFPELAKFRATARLFLLEGQVHEANGEWGRAASSYLDAMEMGERIGHGGPLIHKLVSIACEAIGRRGLLELATNPDARLSARDARQAVARLEGVAARRSGMDESITEEKWGMQTELDRWFRTQNLWQIASTLSGDGMPDATGEVPTPTFAERMRVAGSLLRHSKAQIADAHRRYMDEMIANAKLPYDRARPEPEAPQDFVNRVLTPVFAQAHHKEAETRAENALLTAKLAVIAYRQDNNADPGDWNALVRGGYLRAIPRDPFARNGTDTLRYVGQHARKLPTPLIYSVGPDGVDNGGNPIHRSEAEKHKRWAESQDNGDFVLGENYY